MFFSGTHLCYGPPTCGLLCSWDYNISTTIPNLLIKMGCSNLHILSSWDYSHEPLHLTRFFTQSAHILEPSTVMSKNQKI
jgi:hypothetical protein